MSGIIVNVPEMVSFTQDNQVAEYFQAADQGDLEKVKTFIAENKGKVGMQLFSTSWNPNQILK